MIHNRALALRMVRDILYAIYAAGRSRSLTAPTATTSERVRSTPVTNATLRLVRIKYSNQSNDLSKQPMKTETTTLAAALDVLVKTTKTDDGVFNAAMAEAAQRLREQESEIAGFVRALEHARASLRFFKQAGFSEDRARGEPDALESVERVLNRNPKNHEAAPQQSAALSALFASGEVKVDGRPFEGKQTRFA